MEKFIMTLTLDKALHCTGESYHYAEKLIYDFAKYNLCNFIKCYNQLTDTVIDSNKIFCLKYTSFNEVSNEIIYCKIKTKYYELDRIAKIHNVYRSLLKRHIDLSEDYNSDQGPPLHFLALYYKNKYKNLVK